MSESTRDFGGFDPIKAATNQREIIEQSRDKSEINNACYGLKMLCMPDFKPSMMVLYQAAIALSNKNVDAAQQDKAYQGIVYRLISSAKVEPDKFIKCMFNADDHEIAANIITFVKKHDKLLAMDLRQKYNDKIIEMTSPDKSGKSESKRSPAETKSKEPTAAADFNKKKRVTFDLNKNTTQLLEVPKSKRGFGSKS